MSWIGKLVGAVLGIMVTRSWLGLLVGVILGHQFDRGMSPRRGRRSRRARSAIPPDRQRAFFETTFLVMGHLAKFDGRVTEAEIDAARAIMQRWRLGARETRLAIELFTAGKDPAFQVEQQVERLRRECGRHPELLQLFLELQLELSLAKSEITAAERDLIGRIAEILGVGRLALARIEALLRARRQFGSGQAAQSGGSALDRAFLVLGLEPTASDQEIKQAYRRLMNQHHPDKQAARGLPESMRPVAEERTREIRAAYDAIRENRGFR